jgi:hypothetical protein
MVAGGRGKNAHSGRGLMAGQAAGDGIEEHVELGEEKTERATARPVRVQARKVRSLAAWLA